MHKSISPADREQRIQQFQAATGEPTDIAIAYLEAEEFSAKDAVACYRADKAAQRPRAVNFPHSDKAFMTDAEIAEYFAAHPPAKELDQLTDADLTAALRESGAETECVIIESRLKKVDEAGFHAIYGCVLTNPERTEHAAGDVYVSLLNGRPYAEF